MLDSNLIKKYFKAGLWSKIMLVVFTLVLAVGGFLLANRAFRRLKELQ